MKNEVLVMIIKGLKLKVFISEWCQKQNYTTALSILADEIGILPYETDFKILVNCYSIHKCNKDFHNPTTPK